MTDPWGPPPEQHHRHDQPYGSPPRRPGPQAQPEAYRQRPETPYLERDPYRELSQANLDRQAHPDRDGQDGPGRRRDHQESYEFGAGGYDAARSRAAVKQSNGIAVTGAVLSFIPVLGLIFSVIGRAKVRACGGAGRVAGNIGIALSLVFTGGAGFAVYTIAKSTAADPGCITAETSLAAMSATLKADSTALDSSGKAGFAKAADKFIDDMRNVETQLRNAEAEATHANVRTALHNVDADITVFLTAMRQLVAGDTSGESAGDAAVNRLGPDGDTVDNLCGDLTNG